MQQWDRERIMKREWTEAITKEVLYKKTPNAWSFHTLYQESLILFA